MLRYATASAEKEFVVGTEIGLMHRLRITKSPLEIALKSVLPEAVARVGNPGPHGFSEILYAFSSAGNNNGSAFGGLSANSHFYNLALGMAMWIALCEDSRHWAVFIAPNGDTQVRNCADMHQLSLPQCRPVTPAPPEENNVNNL